MQIYGSERLFQAVEVNEVVDNGIDGEAGRRMNVQFAGDMLTVRHHRMLRDTKHIRNLLIA